jgi:ArsR family transcriptional regulator, arsenate/arsenite/antimonite-responsive transcriptional repressor
MRTLATVFRALSDETRLSMLLLLLREGELCVCDFMEVLGVTQSKASRHLRYLVNAGLLQDRREAVWVYFRIAREPGEMQAAVLSGLRKILPGELPADLAAAFAAWRKCKAAACAMAASKAASPARGARRRS